MKLLIDFFPIILFFAAFKVWGIMPLTLLFSAAQLPLLTRHALDPDAPADPSAPDA